MPALKNKVAVVTGGAQNIGRAIALRFSRAGATVISADINTAPPAAQPGEDTAAALHSMPCDVSNEEQVRALFAAVAQQHGGLHILVNNAGICSESSLENTSLRDWERTMAVNARGVFLCCKHAAKFLRASGGGSIINIGSIEGNGANPAHAAYAASKGAVHALTRNVALELGGSNIRCNAIAPGWIDTPFNAQFLAQYADAPAARRACERLHPLQRLGTEEDIAALALFLAGDDSTFISGQVFTADGGRTACLPLPPL